MKNFCFNEGVKVIRSEILTNDAYDMVVLEKNFFSRPKSHFCLVQQVTPDDVQKYFIFGIKFDDFYITPLKRELNEGENAKSNYVNCFIYEKTYLFISFEPLCNLFEQILQSILNIKKLNFLHNMSDFAYVFIKNNYKTFIEENNEKISVQINEVLNFYHTRPYPHFEEMINFKSDLNNVFANYKYPNPFNEIFLAINWLAKHFFSLIDYETLFNILIRILAENSIIFISDNIQHLTITVLGFSYLIQPFKWPFIIIPNLPIELMNMIESPVPFLIGILGDINLKKKLTGNKQPHNYDIVYIGGNKIELNVGIF